VTVGGLPGLEDVVAAAAALEAGGVRLALGVRDGPGDGFETADRLHAPGPLLDGCVEDAAAAAGTDHLHIGAQWWFEGCAWLAASTAVACALTSGRVPSLAPSDVLIARAGGAAIGLALRRGAPVPATDGLEALAARGPEPTIGTSALAARGPGAASTDALAARVRSEVEAHLGPLVAALRARRLRPAGVPPGTASSRRRCGRARPPTATRTRSTSHVPCSSRRVRSTSRSASSATPTAARRATCAGRAASRTGCRERRPARSARACTCATTAAAQRRPRARACELAPALNVDPPLLRVGRSTFTATLR
jgi:hypothetical protein